MNVPPEVVHDALYLTARIDELTRQVASPSALGATELEVHSLAYFSKLLFEWSEKRDWGYSFYSTPDAEPFATALDMTLRHLKVAGALVDRGELNACTPHGWAIMSKIQALPAISLRLIALDATLRAVQILSLPQTVRAIRSDPTLKSEGMPRVLLDDSDAGLLHEVLLAAHGEIDRNAPLSVVAEVALRYFMHIHDREAA